jgi:hypothetical protein
MAMSKRSGVTLMIVSAPETAIFTAAFLNDL